MKQHITFPVTYFAEEGRVNLDECLKLSFEAAQLHGISKIVVFTAVGEGLRRAIQRYLNAEGYEGTQLVGVTFPQGTKIGGTGEPKYHHFPEDVLQELREKKIPLVRANLPFNSIAPQHSSHGILAQDLSIVGNALNVFGGGMSLCIQSVLLACDAGEIGIGEHVIAMTSDTSLIVRAAPTVGLLTELIVRQVICKPVFLTISKKEEPVQGPAEQEELPFSEDSEAPLLGSGE